MPMPVTLEPTPIDGLLIVKTGVFHDERGYFSESYSKMMWAEAGFKDGFVQDNLSKSSKGTLRGMHWQNEPAGMGKLVRCVHGAVYDVAVDLRKGSHPHLGSNVRRPPSYPHPPPPRLGSSHGLRLRA